MSVELVIVAIGGILTIIATALGIRKAVLDMVDSRIESKAEQVVTAKLTPVLDELRKVTAVLNNGVKARVDEHTVALQTQDEKLDRLTAGQAQIGGRLDAVFELVTQR